MARDNSGYLFKNDRKTEDKHPAYRGKATINGQQYDIAAWVNESDEKGKYLSIKFNEPKQERSNAGFKKEAEDLDDLPF